MQEMTDKVHQENQERSFRQLFWDEQVNALSKSDSRQIRCHPAIIKWCLHLKFVYSEAYHALCSSEAITLPPERTLRNYMHWIKSGIGFQQAVDDQFLKIKINSSGLFYCHSCTFVRGTWSVCQSELSICSFCNQKSYCRHFKIQDQQSLS